MKIQIQIQIPNDRSRYNATGWWVVWVKVHAHFNVSISGVSTSRLGYTAPRRSPCGAVYLKLYSSQTRRGAVWNEGVDFLVTLNVTNVDSQTLCRHCVDMYNFHVHFITFSVVGIELMCQINVQIFKRLHCYYLFA